MRKRTTIILLLLCFCTLSFFSKAILANADDLIIQDNGKVILLITNTDGVLAAETKTTGVQKSVQLPQSNQSPHSAPPAPAKSVPIVPAHTESTIQVKPPINNDKKMQVTITLKQRGQPSQAILPSAPNQTSSAPTGNVITKTVDQVVAQGSNGKPVITITSDNPKQLTIQQGGTKATTTLPLQIDSITHALSVPSTNQPATINVLPAEALQGILNKGFLNTQSARQATINLTKNETGIDYTVQSQKKGKAFGIFPVSTPIQVTLSAENGKIINTSQSLLFNFLGQFIK